MEYQVKARTLDNDCVDVWRSKCFESALKILHSNWSVYSRFKKDFEISLIESDGKNVRPIFFYNSKNIIKLR